MPTAGQIDNTIAYIDRLEADNDKLRAALEQIVKTDPPPVSEHLDESLVWFFEWKNLVFKLKGIARKALAEKE
jgi:hypothetical protein